MAEAATLQRTPEGYPFYSPDPVATGADPYAAAGFVPWTPSAEPQPAAKPSADPYKAAGFVPWSEPAEPQPPTRQVGTGEAVWKGVGHGLTFGLMPAVAGLSEAAGPKTEEEKKLDEAVGYEDPMRPIVGGIKMLHQWATGHKDPSVWEAYERGRNAALDDQRLAQEQHPAAFLSGQLAGTVMVPGLGAMRAAGTGGRIIQGAIQGGVLGGAGSAGEAVSEGKPLPEIAKKTAIGTIIGAPLGGAISGAIGPRAVTAAVSPGQRAARTAEGLGAPLPRGVTSDRPAIQSTTAKLRELPFVGERIGQRVERTQEAAGNRVEGIADTMTGGATNRATADAVVRPGLQGAIDANRQAIDAGYNALRGQIDQNARFTMPRTDAMLNAVMRERQAAGWANPAQGLEQFRTVAGGASFNGAHRARVDAREAGNVLVPHPGYNAADYNRLTRAMTADLREMVRAAATNQTPAGQRAALQAFQRAEQDFGRITEENGRIQRLLNSRGEGAIATLLNAGKERGGNLQLLAQLRQSMPPQDFETIGGLLMQELGHNNATNQFSLAQFATNFGKLSDGALRTLFANSPQHLANVREIAEMGQHIKGALAATSRGQSGGLLVLLDVAKDVALLTGGFTADVMHGGGPGLGTLAASAAGGASTAALYTFAHWLGNPAMAASMGAFSRAYRAVTLGQATPARQATFKIATRNLANTLGVPAERLTQSITAHLGRAGPPEQDQKNDLKK